MRASRVLQKCLPESLGQMHALRETVLLRSVETRKAGEFLCRAGLGPANQAKRRSGRHAAGAIPALRIKSA